MSEEQVLSICIPLCFTFKNVRDAVHGYKVATIRPYLDVVVVTTSFLLMTYCLENRKDTTNAKAVNPNYNLYHCTVQSFYYTVEKFWTARYALDLNFNGVYIKVGILNDCEKINDSCCFSDSF